MLRILVPVLLSLATLAGAVGEGCVPGAFAPTLDTMLSVPGGARYYAHNDCPETGADPPYDACLMYPVMGWWIWEESNGIDGLQRQDENHDDTCGGVIAPDTLIF